MVLIVLMEAATCNKQQLNIQLPKLHPNMCVSIAPNDMCLYRLICDTACVCLSLIEMACLLMPAVSWLRANVRFACDVCVMHTWLTADMAV